ncbi:prepilin-type N-terminal cleavage/methylation domain-containing protein [Oscillatoria sp. CS-180]|uniref:PilW family protein n=1 Tax=Oscillatoria sp. CS-180 TaxID=3021720 RepID=UPI00232BFD4A|nr:prepilin-type N-terminal cleavage/methylation domain-containing protein [Oscillatoria sp. CS-180]MDB9527759.1 prepilin-type N-terminal cleavage/methylation domain-containing protein [Oscillatoria sp. CS-180]
MTPTLSTKFKYRLLAARRWSQQGFTLLELLIAVFIGSIITSGLLFLVIELMTVNSREESLTQTQQDMRRAIDFVSRDVGEAVFVYSDLTDVLSELDDDDVGELVGATPVLGFWRLDPLTDDQVDDVTSYCNSQSDGTPEKDECSTLLVRQNYYTLVIYFQQDNDGTDIWEGPSRVIRYELPKYQSITSSALTQRDGYADPTLSLPTGNGFNSFADWTAASSSTDGITAVLTDFVDEVPDQTTACPTANYARTPADTDSFYVCVSRPSGTPGNDPSDNKSVIVYLQGNASKNPDDPDRVVGLSEASSLPKLESQVLIRGVIQDDPDDPTAPP